MSSISNTIIITTKQVASKTKAKTVKTTQPLIETKAGEIAVIRPSLFSKLFGKETTLTITGSGDVLVLGGKKLKIESSTTGTIKTRDTNGVTTCNAYRVSTKNTNGDTINKDVKRSAINEDVNGNADNVRVQSNATNINVKGNANNFGICGNASNQRIGGRAENFSVKGNAENIMVKGDAFNISIQGKALNKQIKGYNLNFFGNPPFTDLI